MTYDYLLPLIPRLAGHDILVAGDVFLDEYLIGRTERLSREAVNRLLGAVPIRDPLGVTEVEVVVGRQEVCDSPRDRQSAEPRIEHPDGHAGSLWHRATLNLSAKPLASHSNALMALGAA